MCNVEQPSSEGGDIVVRMVEVSNRRRISPVRHAVFVMVGLCMLAGNASAADAPRGQSVYTESKCSICHSISGLGNKKGSLDGVGSKLSADEIRQWITNAPEMSAKVKAERKPAMKAYAALSKEDVDALVVYIQTLKK
jgi:mono/diheme cytochrome c family protein